jgi:hypothetical protein
MSNHEMDKCLAVNRKVVGSSPTSGAIQISNLLIPSKTDRKWSQRREWGESVGHADSLYRRSVLLGGQINLRCGQASPFLGLLVILWNIAAFPLSTDGLNVRHEWFSGPTLVKEWILALWGGVRFTHFDQNWCLDTFS